VTGRDAGGLPRQRGAGGGDRVDRIGLVLGPAGAPVGPVDLDQVDAFASQVAGQAGAVGAGALHPDLG
jgi:hypothetical protein